MAHEKTWQFAMNQAFGDVSAAKNQCDWYVWFTKQALKGSIPLTDQSGASIASPTGLWTLYACCDGVTVNTSGTDLLAPSAFDNTKFVHAAAGTAHSWVVLYSSLLGAYFTIDLSSATVTSWVVVLSKTAPTGGTTTARPTSATDIVLSLPAQTFMSATFGLGRNAHFALATDGSFFSFASQNGTGLVSTVAGVHKVVDCPIADSFPVVAISEFNSNGIWRSTTRFPNGMMYSEYDGTIRNTYNSGSDGFIQPRIGNSASSLLSAPIPDRLSQVPRYAAWVASTTAGVYKGRCQDWFMAPTPADDTTLLPAAPAAATDWQIGQCIIPANVSPSL
jgi:hypothetical protein